jgi:hypothetical protein
MKAIKQAQLREILDAYNREEISYSRMNEMLNELADQLAIGFAEWFADNTLRVDLDGYKTFGDTYETKPHTIKELLEIFKKEKGL